MLILSRKLGESIVVDGKATITINAISRTRVVLSIDAPRDTLVLRKEIVKDDGQVHRKDSGK